MSRSFSSNGIWNQSLTFVGQEFYPELPLQLTFTFVLRWQGLRSCSIWFQLCSLDWLWIFYPASASQVTGITGLHDRDLPSIEVMQTLCPIPLYLLNLKGLILSVSEQVLCITVLDRLWSCLFFCCCLLGKYCPFLDLVPVLSLFSD